MRKQLLHKAILSFGMMRYGEGISFVDYYLLFNGTATHVKVMN